MSPFSPFLSLKQRIYEPVSAALPPGCLAVYGLGPESGGLSRGRMPGWEISGVFMRSISFSSGPAIAVIVLGTILALMAIYVLSMGPALVLVCNGTIDAEAYWATYDPLMWIAARNDCFRHWLVWYIELYEKETYPFRVSNG